METFGVRRAQKHDQERVGTLWLALLEEQAAREPRFDVAEDAPARWRNDFSLWLRDDRRRVFVAARGGEVVGFVTAHRWAPPPIYALSSEVYLDELYVAPEARRSGLGTRLVQAVRAWAEALGADRLRLGVLAVNEAGVAFWKKQAATPFAVTMTVELETAAAEEETTSRKGRLGF